MEKRLSIIVIEEDPLRAETIVDGLREAGDHDIRVLAEVAGLARHIAEFHPDIVLIDLANPSRDMLEDLALASSPTERPVAMFVDRSDEGLTRAALEERKLIDRAKAILMKARDIDEEAAYALLRKTAMDQGKRMGDIAQQLVMAAGLLSCR